MPTSDKTNFVDVNCSSSLRDIKLGSIDSDKMVLNFGPQHPSTHGVLRLEVELEGEIVSQV